MKKKTLILLGITAFGATLIWNTPVSFVASQIKDQIKGLSYGSTSGSIWNGTLHQVVFRKVHLGDVTWSIKPSALLSGALGTELMIREPRFEFDGDVSINFNQQVKLEDSRFNIESEWLDQIKAISSKVKLTGQFTGQIESLETALNTQEPPVVTGRVNWIKGGVTSPLPLKEGNYALTVQPDADNNLLGNIQSQNAPVDTKGTIKLDKQWAYTTDLQLKPEADQGSISNMLSLATKPDANGVFQIKRSGKLF